MLDQSYLPSKATVEIDGNELARDVEDQLEVVAVENSVHLPDMVTLVFRDGDKDILERAHVEIGSELEISASETGSPVPKTLFKGEVTALEGDYGQLGTRAIIRGYDKSHRLHRGRYTKTWRNVTDSDIVNEIAGDVGIDTGQVDERGSTLEYVIQFNQSYWEFLKMRAAKVGFEATVEDGELCWRDKRRASTAPAEGDFTSEGDPSQLVYMRNLLEFRPRITSAEQVARIEVRGWDPNSKQVVVGSKPAGTTSAQLDWADPGRLAGKFGSSPSMVLVDMPFADQNAAEAAAASFGEHVGSGFAQADGVAVGSPSLKAGTAVAISAVADVFTGKYTLTHTRHLFDEYGYRTHFAVTCNQGHSMLAAATPGSSQRGGGERVPGLVVGIVEDIQDPSNHGRVKVRFPWLGDDHSGNWCRVVQPGAGPNSGLAWLPEVGDEVLVGFEHGRIDFPVVLGGLWNGKDSPPGGHSQSIDGGKVGRKGLFSRSGHHIVLDDSDSGSGIFMVSADGNCSISLNQANGVIKIEAQGDVDIQLESEGEVSVRAAQTLTLESDQEMDLRAPSIKIQADVELEAQGGVIKLN